MPSKKKPQKAVAKKAANKGAPLVFDKIAFLKAAFPIVGELEETEFIMCVKYVNRKSYVLPNLDPFCGLVVQLLMLSNTFNEFCIRLQIAINGLNKVKELTM